MTNFFQKGFISALMFAASAGMAMAGWGAVGIGPVATVAAFEAALADAVAQVRAGKSVVIDARILRGYVKEMAEGMTAEQDG